MAEGTFRVLFIDNYANRHGQFRVKSGTSDNKKYVIQRHCHYAGEALHALTNEGNGCWDVVFVPASMEIAANTKEFLDGVVDRCIARPPRLVIFHGSDDTYFVVQRLMEKGVAAAWIPWDYIDLTNHNRKAMKVNKETK